MRRRIVILALAVLTVLTGCMRRDLEYGSVNINLRLRINLNVRVNGNFEELPNPEMMRVMFFDPETFDLITESYLPPTGGRISLPPGKYKFIGYNFDTEATLLRSLLIITVLQYGRVNKHLFVILILICPGSRFKSFISFIII